MADTEQVLNLAAIIREVDGSNNKGAAALAESILDHPRFRAALADEPAAGEPASVTGQPSDEAWDALVERAWDKYQTVGYQGERFMYDRDFDNALEFVRQGLARWGNPAPQPPADGEVAELVAWLQNESHHHDLIGETLLRRAAELLQRQVLVPVSVSERLPGPEDCDAEGRCWWWSAETVERVGCWMLSRGTGAEMCWLPAHALPLPEAE